ncbi:MAG: TIGR01777 family oxidoreductase [Bacteroidota bacterium]
MPSKIIIPGGSGFLGQALRKHFEAQGKEVFILTRNPRHSWDQYWDGKTIGKWTSLLEGAECVINLAGKSVDCRYTPKNKVSILSSRVDSTKILGKAVAHCDHSPKIWLNSSTATIYKDRRGDLEPHTEKEGLIGHDFSMHVAQSWEKALFDSPTPHTRKVALRISFVLGKEGGAWPVILDLAKKGLSGKQASGQQWMSWIHICDFINAIDFILSSNLEGPINITAPYPVQNQDFYRSLADQIKPWVHINQPKWMLELGAMMLGTETELVLKSRKVAPQRLLEAGFRFDYPHIQNAFDALFRKKEETSSYV